MDAAATRDRQLATGRESPERWRIVCVSATEPQWASLAMQLAEAELPHPRIEWVESAVLLMQCLRNDHYNAVVIEHPAAPHAPKPGVRDDGTNLASIDTRHLLTGLRGGGYAGAVVVLMSAPDDDLLATIAEHDAEALVSLSPWDSPALLPMIRRAIRTTDLRQAHRELQLRHDRRSCRDREEAAAMLRRQQDMLANLVRMPDDDLSASLRESYSQFLRTQLTSETVRGTDLDQLTVVLIAADVPAQEVLGLHAAAVQRLLGEMDDVSARPLASRADRLAIDLLARLVDGYRRRD